MPGALVGGGAIDKDGAILYADQGMSEFGIRSAC